MMLEQPVPGGHFEPMDGSHFTSLGDAGSRLKMLVASCIMIISPSGNKVVGAVSSY